MGQPGKVWWDQGAAIACDHDGCKASSDDYDDVRGFVRKDFAEAERKLIANGWTVIGHDNSAALNTNQHFCPQHMPPEIKQVFSEWAVENMRENIIKALKT